MHIEILDWNTHIWPDSVLNWNNQSKIQFLLLFLVLNKFRHTTMCLRTYICADNKLKNNIFVELYIQGKSIRRIFFYHKKNGSQHMRNALIIMPNVRAAFFSRRIFVIAHGSTACILCRCTDIPFICKCLSNKRAATLDLE